MRFEFRLPLTGHSVEVKPTRKPWDWSGCFLPENPTKQALVDEAVALGQRHDYWRMTCKQIREVIAQAKADQNFPL